ncbi:MAG: Ig-like domain-containing protein, partial [Bacteroidota bacterium]|nr:Ig-like domain-containing protein [Bacteroidota bacterium]
MVSPPLEYQPVITPQGGVSKKLTIEIKDTLQDNTTYVLDFGQSIVDNNEGNPFPFFRYVFSTGDVIDSLTVKGKITDALKFKSEKFVNVLLYEVNGEFVDTVVTKGKPNYVLNTLDSLSTFTMQNIKAGTYKMVALKEDNRNLKFDPSSDKIGFVSDLITVPSDQTYELKLFKQAQEPSITKPIFKNPQRWDLGYTGSLDSLNLKTLPEYPINDLRITKLTKKDTLEIWQKPAVIKDSVLFNAYYKQFTDTVKVFYKEEKKDSLVVSKSGKFGIGKNILITATTPIEDYNTNLFKLI